MKNSVINSIKQQIISKGRAKFWFVDDFVAIGNNERYIKSADDLLVGIVYSLKKSYTIWLKSCASS